jgi:polyhydroxybutyrate depolymerase
VLASVAVKKILALSILLAAGCGGGRKSAPPTVFGGDRPVTIQVPSGYDGSTPAPLLLLLHGYSVDASIQEAYFQIAPLVESEGLLILAPNGTLDPSNYRFWNATPACCDLYGSGVDDEGYLKGLLHDVRAAYNVDPKRIYVIGHSNGAFMAHRMACHDAGEIAAIVSLAGETYLDTPDCGPSGPVSVLQIQGDADATIAYGGGQNGTLQPYPGAVETVTDWQVNDGCTAGLVDDAAIDLDTGLAGAETGVQHFAGCSQQSAVELWTIHGGAHIPAIDGSFATKVWAWMSAHPKP